MIAVIAGCSHRKAPGVGARPALELYEGGCIPQLRARIAAHPDLRARVFVLSARYGLIAADDCIATYDQQMTLARARHLRQRVGGVLDQRVLTALRPRELVLLVEPLYLVALADLLRSHHRPVVHWFPEPATDWPAAQRLLDRWGWPV